MVFVFDSCREYARGLEEGVMVLKVVVSFLGGRCYLYSQRGPDQQRRCRGKDLLPDV